MNMLKISMRIIVLAGFLIVLENSAVAQQIVHALTGTVSAIDPSQKSITVLQDGGSKSTFKLMSSSKTRIAFDKMIKDEATSAQQFQKQGAYVILFYFGIDQNRTAVAVKNLGQGPFAVTTGNVTRWDGKNHKLIVRGKDGKARSFSVDGQSVAETSSGAVNGSDFHPDKGDHVRVVSFLKDGTPTALFIRAT
jgi:hypothetical protein